jgi:hypothetical protein
MIEKGLCWIAGLIGIACLGSWIMGEITFHTFMEFYFKPIWISIAVLLIVFGFAQLVAMLRDLRGPRK